MWQRKMATYSGEFPYFSKLGNRPWRNMTRSVIYVKNVPFQVQWVLWEAIKESSLELKMFASCNFNRKSIPKVFHIAGMHIFVI